jgi:RibD domain-containing protein
MSLDRVIQAPGGKNKDWVGGFEHGGCDIGQAFGVVRGADAPAAQPSHLRPSRRRIRARSGARPIRCRRDEICRVADVREAAVARHKHHSRQTIDAIRALKSEPGGNILTDGSSQFVHALLEHDLVDELHLFVYWSPAAITPAHSAGRRRRLKWAWLISA